MDWLVPVRELFDSVLPFLDRIPLIRMLLGSILVFFLPGFGWTFVFFQQIKVIERVVLSVALYFVLVTISLLFLNRLIGVRINGFNSVLLIVTITVVPVAIYYLNRLIKRRKGMAA